MLENNIMEDNLNWFYGFLAQMHGIDRYDAESAAAVAQAAINGHYFDAKM